METIELTLSEFSRRSRSVLVEHSTTTLGRGLDHGETVLVRDGETYRSASVADVTFELTDTHYRLELGPVISETELYDAELRALLRTARTLQRQSAYVARQLGGSGAR